VNENVNVNVNVINSDTVFATHERNFPYIMIHPLTGFQILQPLETWGFEDDYLKLASNKNNKEKAFIFDNQKRNCFKCQIFVARAFATYQVLNKTESFGPSLESKIKVYLECMDNNVRGGVINQIEPFRNAQPVARVPFSRRCSTAETAIPLNL
jgi:hypothetical protein